MVRRMLVSGILGVMIAASVSRPAGAAHSDGGSPDDAPVDWVSLVANAPGRKTVVSTAQEFNAAAAAAQPGDVILVADGIHRWNELTIPSNGTAEKPIIYTAQTPGGVTFSSAYWLMRIYGDFNIIGGFTIDNVETEVFELVEATDNRITDNTILSPRLDGGHRGWLEIRNHSHRLRFDHNTIVNTNGWIRLTLPDADPKVSEDVRIDHNVFDGNLYRPTAYILQVGQSTIGNTLYPRLLFEHNTVRNLDMNQMISNVSSGNVYRYNTFVNNRGQINLLQGHDVQVYGNYFENTGTDKSTITASGSNHLIYNNVIFIDRPMPPTDIFGAITSNRWGPRNDGTELPRTGNNFFAYNTIIAGPHRAFSIGAGSNGTPYPIEGSLFVNNILINSGPGAQSEPELFKLFESGCTGCEIRNNLYHPTGTAKLGTGFNYDTAPIVGDPELSGFRPIGASLRVIDAAVETDPPIQIDQEGTPRAAPKDLGAIEFQDAPLQPGPFMQPTSDPQGIVSMEAEHAMENTAGSTHRWQTDTVDPQSAGGKAMVVVPDNGTNYSSYADVADSPRLDFAVEFTKTGTHYVWIRGKGADHNGDSVHAGLNGEAPADADKITNFGGHLSPVDYTSWHWSKLTMDGNEAIIEVPGVGLHTVHVWMREDGFKIDKIVLTTDPDFVPVGDGPRETRLEDSLPVAEAPVIQPNGGQFVDSVEVTLSSGTEGAEIYYSIDGGQPDVLYGGAFVLTASATVKVIAIADGYRESAVAEAVFQYTPAPDIDGDGITDAEDNCIEVSNPDQRDTNGDGFGNMCDPDMDNNGVVNFSDVALLRDWFGSSHADADLDGNGTVGVEDASLAEGYLGGVPGPSALLP